MSDPSRPSRAPPWWPAPPAGVLPAPSPTGVRVWVGGCAREVSGVVCWEAPRLANLKSAGVPVGMVYVCVC
eukprot:1156973-Pelagomonas_calceolata.AAC.11